MKANKKKRSKEIKLAFFALGISFLSIEIQFVSAVLIICFLVIFNKLVIHKHLWLLPLMFIPFIGFLSGTLMNNLPYNFFRDLSYYTLPLLYIFIGAEIYSIKKITINPLRFIVLYTLFETIVRIISLSANELDSFNSFRSYLIGGGELLVPLSLCLLFFKDASDQELFISNKTKNFLILIFSIRLVISFSRTMLIMFAFIFCVFLIYKTIANRRIKLSSEKIKYGFLILSLILLFIFIIPKNYVEILLLKFNNISQELTMELNWNNPSVVINNWRGYEMYTAMNVFHLGSVWNKVVGYGFGKLIPVSYIELVGVDPSTGGITLLHNGYMTNLIKVGIIGTTLYISWFIMIIIKCIKTYGENLLLRSFLSGLSFAMLIATMVIGGLYNNNPQTGLLISIGMCLSKLNLDNKQVKEKNNKLKIDTST